MKNEDFNVKMKIKEVKMMKKINWKRFLIALVVFIVVDVVLLIIKQEANLANIVYYILRGLNLAAFVVFGVSKSVIGK